jgi:spore coat polysaccharide biosynthesis protein SpsF (cytidylyltransferase family)
MKIVATIEARMTSTRLPGKVLMPALGNQCFTTW